MTDIALVRHTYEQMTNEELTRLAVHDAAGLTPEALEIVKGEIAKRKLDTGLEKSVDAQNRSYTIEEIDVYCELLRRLPCPFTGSTAKPLNATLTMEVKSFIFFTQYKQKIVVASPEALKQANNAAIGNSLALGLWGFPWGIIRTIQAVVVNTKNKKNAKLDSPSDHLRGFVVANIGQIEMLKNDRDKLFQFLKAASTITA